MKNIYKVNNEVEQSGTNIRLKSRISPMRARVTSDSIVSRICLVSLILLIVGGFSTSAWGESCTVNLANTSTASYDKGDISLSFSGVSQNSNGFELASTGSGSSEKDKLQGTMTWSNKATGYTIKVTSATAGFKTEIKYNAYGVYGRIYSGDQSSYTSRMYTNGGTGTASATISKATGFGNTFTFTAGRNSVSGKTYLNYVTLNYTKTANSYDVTLAPNGGSGSNQTVSATYANGMPTTLKVGGAIVKPSMTGYTFAGYFDATSGGTKYYNADLSSAKDWDKASTATLSAQWIVNQYTITLTAGEGVTSAGTKSIKATYDASTNLTSAITTPTKSGYVFDGYYTGANGTGTQIINAFGNIIANAGGGSTYIDADKKWKYDGDIELHAHWIEKYDFEITGSNYTINNEAWTKTGAFTFVHADEAYMTTTIQNPDVISYDRQSNTITALKTGTSKITFTQNTSTTVKNGSLEWTITVSLVDNTLALKGSSYTRYVEEDDDLTSFVTTNSNGTLHTSSTPTGIAHYDIANNKIVIDNSSNTSFNSTSVTIKIWQDATIKYAGIAEANAKTLTLTVKKYDNTISVKGNENYSNSIYVDSYDNEFAFTATNTDYSGSPFQVDQTAGTDIATYYPNDKVVYSSYKLGTATWSVTQPENYKYKDGSASFSVTVVAQDEATDCYVKTDLNKEHEFRDGSWEMTWNDENAAGRLTFEAKAESAWTYGLNVFQYINGSWDTVDPTYISYSELHTSYHTYGFDLDPRAKGVKFERTGTLRRWIKNVYVTRKTRMTVPNITITKQADASTQIYPGTEGPGTLRINYSLANGGDLKIACDNDKFKFTNSKTAANVNSVVLSNYGCSTGYVDVPVYYTSNVAGIDVAHVVVYNDVYRAEATITGTTVQRTQSTAWIPNTDLMAVGQELEDVFISTTFPEVKATYVSSDPTVIRVDNYTKLVALKAGKANIEATIVGNAEYANAVDAKDIEVTSDLVQRIEWDQTFMNCKLGDGDRPLDAHATSDVDCAFNNARPIDYTSSDNTVATIVEGNQLRVLKVGTAILTATQEGGEDTDGHKFARVSATRKVVVKDPNAPCEYAFYTQKEDKEFDLGWNATNHKSGNMTLTDLKGNEPRTINFDYRGEAYNVVFTYYSGNIIVEEYINGNWVTKHSLGTYSSGVDHNSGDLALDRGATQIRITVQDGMGKHYIKNCVVTLARYIESDAQDNTVSFSAKVGETQTKHIKLSYSEIKDNITLTMGQGANSHFSVSPSLIEGECGAKAKDVDVAITYSPAAATENESELLTISDGRESYKVTLNGAASKTDRTIDWSAANTNTAYTVETIQLSASAKTALNASAGSVYFSLKNNSTAGSISTTNVLSFANDGIAYVTANTVTDYRYNAAPEVGPKRWDVSKTPTSVTIAPTVGTIVSGTAANAIVLNTENAVAGYDVNGFSGTVDGTWSVIEEDLNTVGNNRSIKIHFEPNNTDMFLGCDGYINNVTVSQREATAEEIGTVSAAAITYGQTAVGASTLSNDGSLTGTWEWTDSRKNDQLAAYTYNDMKARFTPDNKNIQAKIVDVTLVVNKANPAVTPQASAITYNQPISASSLTTKTGDVSGTWSWGVDDTQVLTAGDHDLKANFTSGNANYKNLSNVDVKLTVNKATSEATPSVAAHLTYGQKVKEATLNNTGTDGTWAWKEADKESVLTAGKHTLNVDFTPTNSNYTTIEDIAVELIVDKATTTATANDIVLTYGETPNSKSLSTASAALEGQWAWNDERYDDVLNASASAYALNVTFTPNNNNYASYATTVNVTVNKATTTASANDIVLTYGETPNSKSLSTASAAEEGQWAWNDERYDDVLNASASAYALNVTFTPNNNNYASYATTVNVTVNQATPNATPSAEAITFGNAVKTSTLSNTGTTAGTWAWKEADEDLVPTAGKHIYLVDFTPDDDNYTALSDIEVELTVNKATPAVTPQATAIDQGQTVSQSTLSTKTGLVPGTWSWKNEDAATKPNQGNYNLWVDFTPDDTDNYNSLTNVQVSLTVNAPSTYVFTGEGDWTVDENWNASSDPAEAVDVIVNGNVIISTNVTVKSLTVEEGKSVTITSTGKLTLGEDSSEDRDHYGDLYVHNGGKVVLGEGTLQVNDFKLDAKLGNSTNAAASGQVNGSDKLNVNGDAFFQMTFDPNGAITYGWYDFTVPFEVEVLNGIYDANGNKLTNGVDYLVMNYNEAKRAVRGKDWNMFSGTMQPGHIYSITLDASKNWNTFLFKRKANSDVLSDGSYAAEFTPTGAEADHGWNGFGNGTLQHMQLKGVADEVKIQLYNHSENRYEAFDANEKAFAVGTAFFMQVKEANQTIEMETSSKALRAPSYAGNTTEEFRLSLTADNDEVAADRLWISASEDATTEYTIGHDLVKMGTPTQSKVAQMWMPAGELRLCDIEMPLVNNNASTALSIYAPKAGTYTLAVERAPENAILFLTKNGRVMWNLSQSGYLLDLTKGMTEEYGLCLVYSAPQVATGVDEVVSGVKGQKVIIDNKIYIITNTGDIYDATGKKVN